MQRLARKPGVWGTIVGIAVLVLLSVLGIIPLDVARGITAGVSMLVAIGLVVALPLVMVVLLTRMLRRPRRRRSWRGWEPFPEGQTAIGVGPLTQLSADWTGTGPGLKRRQT